jgi:hypothetical protein
MKNGGQASNLLHDIGASTMIRWLVLLLSVSLLLSGCRREEKEEEEESQTARLPSNIKAGETQQFVFRFGGGERACVILHPNPMRTDTNDMKLQIFVYDQNGKLITKDDAGEGYCAVEWYPPQTADYLIEVVNRSASPTRIRAVFRGKVSS